MKRILIACFAALAILSVTLPAFAQLGSFEPEFLDDIYAGDLGGFLLLSDLGQGAPTSTGLGVGLTRPIMIGEDFFDDLLGDGPIGESTEIYPIASVNFFSIDPNSNANYNTPGGFDQILDDAYFVDFLFGLESDTLLTRNVSLYWRVAGGVDLRWGNLVLNPQGFNPLQTQVNTPNPTEFDAAGFFRTGGGLRIRGQRGGVFGVGVFGQWTNTSFPTGIRHVESSLMLQAEFNTATVSNVLRNIFTDGLE